MSHRNPWAEDERAPSQDEARRQEEAAAPAPAPAPAPKQPENNRLGEPLTSTAGAGSERTVRRRLSTHLAAPTSDANTSLSSGPHVPNDVLVVVSKLKAYIRARSECNTSASVNAALSDIIREHCDLAMQRALADGRTTVMDRDFKE